MLAVALIHLDASLAKELFPLAGPSGVTTLPAYLRLPAARWQDIGGWARRVQGGDKTGQW